MAELREYKYKRGYYLRTVVEGHYVTYQLTAEGEEYLAWSGGPYDGYEVEKWEVIQMVQEGYLVTGGSGVGEEVDDYYFPVRTSTQSESTENQSQYREARMSNENLDFAAQTLPENEESSEPDLSTGAGDVNEAQGVYDQPALPPTDGAFGARRNCLMWLFVGTLISLVVVFVIVLFCILGPGCGLKSTPTSTRIVSAAITSAATTRPTATPTSTPSPTPTITPTPTPNPTVILVGIKALGELNTIQYNLETVVEKQKNQERGFPWSDRHLHFLLVASGRVKAGVDFKEIVRYEIDDDKVTVYLPAPRITDYSVDMQSLEMYYIRDDGLDEKLAIEAYNEAIVEAQERLREAALRSDILETAKSNATALVQSLILGLGFSEVEVNFLPLQGNETWKLDEPLELIPTLAPFPTKPPEE